MAPLGCEGGGPFLEQLAHPIKRFKVMLQRGPTEQSHLRDVRRAQSWHAALAFDGFNHRRLFAADVGPRAAPQLDLRQWGGRIRPKLGEFRLEKRAAAMVF